MEKIPRIKNVKPLKNRHLEIQFDNGIIKDYDCNQIIDRPKFYLLHDDLVFNSVKVDTGGYGISWNDDMDISEYEVWVNGKGVE